MFLLWDILGSFARVFGVFSLLMPPISSLQVELQMKEKKHLGFWCQGVFECILVYVETGTWLVGGSSQRAVWGG